MNTAILSRWALVVLSGTFSSERLIVFCQEANDWVLFGLAVVAISVHWLTILAAKDY